MEWILIFNYRTKDNKNFIWNYQKKDENKGWDSFKSVKNVCELTIGESSHMVTFIMPVIRVPKENIKNSTFLL